MFNYLKNQTINVLYPIVRDYKLRTVLCIEFYGENELRLEQPDYIPVAPTITDPATIGLDRANTYGYRKEHSRYVLIDAAGNRINIQTNNGLNRILYDAFVTKTAISLPSKNDLLLLDTIINTGISKFYWFDEEDADVNLVGKKGMFQYDTTLTGVNGKTYFAVAEVVEQINQNKADIHFTGRAIQNSNAVKQVRVKILEDLVESPVYGDYYPWSQGFTQTGGTFYIGSLLPFDLFGFTTNATQYTSLVLDKNTLHSIVLFNPAFGLIEYLDTYNYNLEFLSNQNQLVVFSSIINDDGTQTLKASPRIIKLSNLGINASNLEEFILGSVFYRQD